MGAIIKTKQDVMEILHQNRDRLKSLGVCRIGLFGSFVREEQLDDSDIDLSTWNLMWDRKPLMPLWSCPFI